MQSSKSVMHQNVRRLCFIVGFAFFLVFAYKGVQEVSNPKIAAGVQRRQVASVTASVQPAIATQTASYSLSSSVTTPSTETTQTQATKAGATEPAIIKKSIRDKTADVTIKEAQSKASKTTSAHGSKETE